LERLIPVLSHDTLLHKAVELARTVRDPQNAAVVLTSLVRRPSAPHRPASIAQARAAIDSIDDGAARAQAIVNLTVAIIDLPRDDMHTYFNDALRVLATRSRAELLIHFATLAPVIHALGGEAAVREVDSAIRDVELAR
jgi:hypothetical protein